MFILSNSCTPEGGEGERLENHFPCWFHRDKRVKDHTPTVILSSLSPPCSLLSLLKEEFPPSACWLSDWVIDGFIRRQDPSFIDKISVSVFLSRIVLHWREWWLVTFSFLWIKPLFPLHLRGWTDVRAYVSQYSLGRRETGLKDRRKWGKGGGRESLLSKDWRTGNELAEPPWAWSCLLNMTEESLQINKAIWKH